MQAKSGELRSITIPPNKIGLGQGAWLRWTELRLWLLDHDARALADEIEEIILRGNERLARKVVVQ